MTLLDIKKTLYKLSNLDIDEKLSIEEWLDLITIIQSHTTDFKPEDFTREIVEAYWNGSLETLLQKRKG